MQILYKVVGGAGNYILLYDQGAIAPSLIPSDKPITPGAMPTWKPEFTGVKQSDSTFTTPGGTVQRFRQPLGNVECRIQVMFQVGYATDADAVASIRTYASLMQQLIHFQLIQDGETQYYPNAVVETCSSEPQGVNVTHSFSFTSDLVTAAAPP